MTTDSPSAYAVPAAAAASPRWPAHAPHGHRACACGTACAQAFERLDVVVNNAAAQEPTDDLSELDPGGAACGHAGRQILHFSEMHVCMHPWPLRAASGV